MNQGRRRLLPKLSNDLPRKKFGEEETKHMQECASLGMPMRCSELKKMVNSSGTDAGCSHGAPLFSKADQSESQVVFQQQRIKTYKNCFHAQW